MLLFRPDCRLCIILSLLAVASHCLGVGGIGRSRRFGVQEGASCDPGLAVFWAQALPTEANPSSAVVIWLLDRPRGATCSVHKDLCMTCRKKRLVENGQGQ